MIFRVVFLLLISTLTACATTSSLDTSTAQASLAQAWQANQHVVWEIEWPAVPVGGSLTVETWRAGPAYRYEILEAAAPNLVGQILIFDGQTAWRYNRFASPGTPQPVEAQLSPVTDAFAVIARLLAMTPATATQKRTEFAQQPAHQISLTFTNGPTLTFWRDEMTGLPVRVEVEAAGQPLTLRARSFEPLMEPPEKLFNP